MKLNCPLFNLLSKLLLTSTALNCEGQIKLARKTYQGNQRHSRSQKCQVKIRHRTNDYNNRFELLSKANNQQLLHLTLTSRPAKP